MNPILLIDHPSSTARVLAEEAVRRVNDVYLVPTELIERSPRIELLTENDMSLKSTLVTALLSMGLTTLANKIDGQTKHFNVPDPVLPTRRKKSSGGKGGSAHTWGIRPRPRHKVMPARECYVAPPPMNKSRRKLNKLEVMLQERWLQRVLDQTGDDNVSAGAGDTSFALNC